MNSDGGAVESTASLLTQVVQGGALTVGVISAVTLVSATVFAAFRTGLGPFLTRLSDTMVEIIGSLVGVSSSPQQSSVLQRDIAKLVSLLERAQSQPSVLSTETEQKITNIFEHALEKGLSEELKIALTSIVGAHVRDEIKSRSSQSMAAVLVRLGQASRTSSVRGFFNLAIGVAFAIMALVFLRSAIDLFTAEELSNLTIPEVIYTLGVRASLALIITLIAYFFLALYKKSLEDVKFYQNEMTEVSMRAVVIEIANDSNVESIKQFLAAAILREKPHDKENLGGNTDVPKIVSVLLEKLVDKLPNTA